VEERYGFGRRERRHRVLDLAVHAQELPARAAEREVGTGLHEPRQRRRSLDHLLQVVEEQEHLPVGDVRGEPVACAERLGDRLPDERRLANAGEPDPEDARLVRGNERGRHLDGQTGLAGAARTGQRQEPRSSPERREHFGELALPADERARGPWQVRVRDRLQWREALLTELEDRHCALDVLEPVLPEIGEVRVDEGRGRRRQDHLAAVTCRGDSRSEVDVVPDVTLVGHERSPGVQTHPDLDRSGSERLGESGGGRQRSGRRREGEEEGVSLGIDLDAPLGRARLPDQQPVLGECLGVGLRSQLAQELRRALDVREEEGDGTAR
jgi:hypothetical protein